MQILVNTAIHMYVTGLWKTESDQTVTLGLFHFIGLTIFLIATLIYYPFTLPLPGLADWSAFHSEFYQPYKFRTETIGSMEGTTWKAWVWN